MHLKNAYLVGNEHNTNIALMLHGSFHRQDSEYGLKQYDAIQRTAYASLIFEHDFDERHSLSSGLSYGRDYYNQRLHGVGSINCGTESENVSGAYAQYTLNLHDKLIAMVGLRADISSEYDGFVTPRTHIKWAPNKNIALRVSAGKGYRNCHALAENNYLLTSGRTLHIENDLRQEEAWNYGVSGMLRFPIFGRGVTLNAEYYRTQFDEQVVIDYDSNPSAISIHNLNGGKSYSNTFQVDATCMVFEGMTITAAYRLNDVKCTFGNAGLLEKPLTSKYKGLISASYKTPLALWQFDATLQLNGGGRIPAHYDADNFINEGCYHSFEQLQAQITREFRHFSVYVGAENITAFRQKNPFINAENPWDSSFDPTLVWGPVTGRMFYVGVRVNFEKI
jgi:outer membrane receptor protein involved in Fe transport